MKIKMAQIQGADPSNFKHVDIIKSRSRLAVSAYSEVGSGSGMVHTSIWGYSPALVLDLNCVIVYIISRILDMYSRAVQKRKGDDPKGSWREGQGGHGSMRRAGQGGHDPKDNKGQGGQGPKKREGQWDHDLKER